MPGETTIARTKPPDPRTRFVELRRAAQLTQAAMAERLGISRPYVSLIEMGRRVPKTHVLLKAISELAEENGLELPPETWLP